MSIQIYKQNTNAVLPSRAHSTDIGLDLVAIKVHKVVNPYTIMYDTGIVAIPPTGYYLEITPRSSISKSGWMLANSIGIVDPDYRGNLYIVLTRVVPNAEEIELPFCKCQLVLRKSEYAPVVELSSLEDFTERGYGGFGSTGTRT